MLIVCCLYQKVLASDEKLFLRIVAPKFICENDKNVSDTSNNTSNEITISLQTREGQKLKFQIEIEFQLIDGGFISQKHTLSIWKNIRNLQKKFFEQSNEITKSNQIKIDSNDVSINSG